MRNEKTLEKMKSNQLRDELEKLKRELRKRDDKENMAPPVLMAPPSMTPPIAPNTESMATQQSQAQYDNFHQCEFLSKYHEKLKILISNIDSTKSINVLVRI